MQTIEVLSQLKNDNLLDNQSIEDISQIDNDVIGTGVFLNILLSLGALVATLFVLSFVATIAWSFFDQSEDIIWIGTGIIAATLIGAGYIIHSPNNLFKLRLSSFFLAIGKLTAIVFIIERLGAYIGYDWLYENIMFIALLALMLAIINLYLSRMKLEVFLLLFGCVLVLKFVISDFGQSISGAELPFIAYADSEFLINCGLWIWAILSLLVFNLNYKNRLPFYAFIAAQIILGLFNINVFNFVVGFNLNFGMQVVFNLIVLAPSIYLILNLQKPNGQAIDWQYYALFGLLFVGCLLPISNLYIILFCFLFGYTQRDGIILASAYILTPIFVYNLYRRLDLTLDTASTIAIIIGIGFLVAFGIVRFSQFKQSKQRRPG